MGPSKHAKDIVSVIIAKRMGKGRDAHEGAHPPEDDEKGGSSSEGEHSAAEDILQAIEDSDAEALASALKDFYRICSGEEDSPEEEKEESKDEGY